MNLIFPIPIKVHCPLRGCEDTVFVYPDKERGFPFLVCHGCEESNASKECNKCREDALPEAAEVIIDYSKKLYPRGN